MYKEAITEFELMEEMSGETCRTDAAIGIGRYRKLSFDNKAVGYVICGMEEPDRRLYFEVTDDELAGNLVARDLVTDEITDITDNLNRFYEKFGSAMRYFHDSGYSHRYPHIANIGIKFAKTNQPQVILRDLNQSVDMIGKKIPEKVVDRFLDVSRVLYDLLRNRDYWAKYEDESEWELKVFPELAIAFLKGYFYELDTAGTEFKTLSSLTSDFVRRIASLAGVSGFKEIDYEELNEENPYFGRLIKQLQLAEEALSEKLAKNLRQTDVVRETEFTMDRIHELNANLLAPVKENKILWHVIPLDLIPHSLRSDFAHMIYRLNTDYRYKDLKERIEVVEDMENIDKEVRRLASSENNIVMVAVPDEKYLENLPKGVRGLVFEGEPGDYRSFKQIECILAALRALYLDDAKALIELYEITKGEKFTGTEEDMLAGNIKFYLKPITIEDPEDRDRLNKNLLELIRAA